MILVVVSRQKDTVLAERDLLMVVVIKLEAVEADVVWVSPGCQQVQLKNDCREPFKDQTSRSMENI